MEIYNIKIVWKDTIKKIYNNPFHKRGLIPKIYNVTLTKKIYSSAVNDIYQCEVVSGNKLIYEFTISIVHIIDDTIRVTVNDFKSFKDFHQFVKFIINDVLDESNGEMRIIYKVPHTDYSLKMIDSDKRFQKMICYQYGNRIAEVELSSNYNRDVKIYDMVKGECIELPYTYKLNAFGQFKYQGESETGMKLLDEKRSEVLNIITICQTFIRFDPLDYYIV